MFAFLTAGVVVDYASKRTYLHIRDPTAKAIKIRLLRLESESKNRLTKTRLGATDRISVALETNGIGYIGFLAELPGAFVRGRTEEEALSKVDSEITSYLRWIGITRPPSSYNFAVTQRHQCSLMVQDADCEILLESDRRSVEGEEFLELVKLVRYSGETFVALYNQSQLKNWIDQTRIRKTFYGENPKTIQEIFDHVNGTQYYYLSRAQVPLDRNENDFMGRRESCLGRLEELYHKDGNSRVWEEDKEFWTLKKILRRFIWHDRIHGKAIARILESQKRLSLIGRYDNPFFFELSK